MTVYIGLTVTDNSYSHFVQYTSTVYILLDECQFEIDVE